MNRTERALRQVPLFASLPAGEIRRLADTLRPVSVPANTVLFHEGEQGDHFYIVVDGQVEVIKAMGAREERLLGARQPGEFIGEMSLLTRDGLRAASVYAREPALLLEMTRAEFDALLHRQPMLAYEMVKVLSARLRVTMDEAVRDLRNKNQQLTEAYEALKAAQAQIIEKEKLERELQVAYNIQMSILPRTLPALDGFDLGACTLPARTVGGDWYDFIPLDNGATGIVVGDVSDKGVPAALFMAQTHALLRGEALRAASPREALLALNRRLFDLNAHGFFVTVLYGVLEPETGTFAYARAGHEVPLICTAQGQISPCPTRAGQLLGLFEEPLLDEQTLTLPPGGTLLLFSDGVVDACTAQDDAFGVNGLEDALRACVGMPAQHTCDHILEATTCHCRDAPQYDDITLVAVCAA